MVARQVTFTANETVQDLIKEANIPDKRQSQWINDKIIHAVMIEKEKPIETPQFEIRKVKIP